SCRACPNVLSRRGTEHMDRRRLSAVVLILVAAGCSRAMLEPMPDVKGRVAIKISTEAPNGSDLGVGAHQLPDTQVYVTGYFTDAMQTGQYFGVIGMIASNASPKSP